MAAAILFFLYYYHHLLTSVSSFYATWLIYLSISVHGVVVSGLVIMIMVLPVGSGWGRSRGQTLGFQML